MRILFIAQTLLRRTLGGPKVVMELTEAVNKNGHFAEVVGPEEVEKFLHENKLSISKDYADNVKTYLDKVIHKYDVIDCDLNYLHRYLEDKKKNADALIVARSVLLLAHLKNIKWPDGKSFIRRIVSRIKHFQQEKNIKDTITNSFLSVREADLVNVSNNKDKELLIKLGTDASKIVVLPYGISEVDYGLYDIRNCNKDNSLICFLGTFDYRKGCLDIPKIFSEVKKSHPDVKLLLLGCGGLFRTEKEILQVFPVQTRSSIQIVLEYSREDLPKHLEKVSLGIFPSYLEGFGFSVIEMIAAGIPVIAYDSPGPSDILPGDYLVPPGDYIALAKKVVGLIENRDAYANAKSVLEHRSLRYQWPQIAQTTIGAYQQFLRTELSFE